MGRYWKPATPHVGLGYLSETLLTHGHQVEIADMRLGMRFGELVATIKKLRPDYIGITAASLEYQKVYTDIALLKNIFDIPIILGGPHASVVREQILQYSKTDLVVVGEGEQTILEIAKRIPYKNIQGLIWRDRRGNIITNPPRLPIQNLDTLPFTTNQKFKLK